MTTQYRTSIIHACAAALGALACSAALAQTPVMPGPNTSPAPGPNTPNATDCSKGSAKTLPECSQDSRGGNVRPTDPSVDRGMVRDTPRTNDGMNGPMSAPKAPGDAVEGGKNMAPVPR